MVLPKVLLWIVAITASAMAGGFSSLRQAINVPALRKLGSVFARPRLLLPTIDVASVADLNMVRLHQDHGIRCVVFDKDQTLSLTYVDELHESAVEPVARCKALFGERQVAILSNSVGSSDDEGYRAAAATERSTEIAVIRHVYKKPACLPEVLNHFSHVPNLQPREICVIGDRLLTDVLFANLNGMTSVLVAPISTRGDHPVAVVIRAFERRILLPLARLFFARRK